MIIAPARLQAIQRWMPLPAGLIVVLGGLLALVGGLMLFSTALAFMLAGSALVLLGLSAHIPNSAQRPRHLLRTAVAGSAGSVTLLGLVALLAHETGGYSTFVGTSSSGMDLNLFLAGLALLLFLLPWRGGLASAHMLTCAALLNALRMGAGYLLGIPELFLAQGTIGMALLSSALFVVLCLGLLALHPDRAVVGLALDRRAGGLVLRRLLPAAILIPLAGEALSAWNVRAELFGPGFAMILLMSANILIFFSVARALNQADQARAQTEAALHATESHLQTLFNQAPAFIALHEGPEHTYIFSNPLHDQVVGQRTLIGLPLREAMPDLMDQGIFERFDQVYQTGAIDQRHEMPATFVRQGNGTHAIGYFNQVLCPWRDAAGAIQGVMSFAVDVTDIVQTRQQLAASEARFRRAFIDAPFPIIIHADDDQVIEINTVWTEITGYTRDDIPTIAAWIERAYGPRKTQVRMDIDRLYSLDRRIYEGEFTITTKQGHQRVWEFSSAPLGVDSLGRRMVISMAADITERKQAEEALRAGEHRLRSFVEALNQAVWRTNAAGEIDQPIPSWQAFTGQTAEAVCGWGWFDAIHPDDRAASRQAWQTAVTQQQIYEMTHRVRRYDGTYRWCTARGVPVHDVHGTICEWVGTHRDIHERKQAEMLLQQYTERLQLLSRRLIEVQETERKHIARELHDEVGQVLTGVKLVLDMAGTLSREQLPAYLDDARQAINDLLVRVRNLSLNLRPTMLDDFGLLATMQWHIERYVSQTQVQVRWRHHGIDRRFAAPIEATVYRVVQETLTNVARHAQAREVSLRLLANGNRVRIRINDNGSGFDVDAALNDPASSGLIGMRERVMLLGGSLQIDSAVGQGTQLLVELPLEHTIISGREIYE